MFKGLKLNIFADAIRVSVRIESTAYGFMDAIRVSVGIERSQVQIKKQSTLDAIRIGVRIEIIVTGIRRNTRKRGN